tara:strand:- start:155 stop:682 length:528 start_codon:yes stop_codon:yes gene_type:complete
MTSLKIALILLCLLFQPLLAEEKSVLFTVDMSQLLRSSDFGKNIIANNNAARQNLQNENNDLEEKLLIEEKELSELRKILSIDEFRPKALEFDKKVTIIRKGQREKEENLNKKVRREETDFFKKIYPILYELLIERGGLVLVDQRNAILWDNSVDLTDDAIALINQALASGIKTN